MGHVQRRSRTRKGRDGQMVEVVYYRARYVGPDGRERGRNFHRRRHAENWMLRQTSQIASGDWVDPDAGRITVGEWADQWVETKRGKKAKTYAGYREIIRSRVKPTFGRMELRHVRRVDVEQWISAMDAEGLSASRIRNCFNVLAATLDSAVEHELLPRNPARSRSRGRSGGVELPKVRRARRRYLTAEQVARLAGEVPDAVASFAAHKASEYQLVIYVLAYGGIRWNELVALRREDVDLLRRRITIDEGAKEVEGHLVWEDTKTDEIYTPKLPAFVAEMLAVHLAAVDVAPQTVVFGAPRGGPLRYNDFLRYVWRPAVESAGLDGVTPHELRHTCAALLIAGGADPKTVQEQLGHRSIKITYDVYGHLWEGHADDVFDRLDEQGRSVDGTSAGGEVVGFG